MTLTQKLKRRFSTPASRSMLLFMAFACILFHVVSQWVFTRFVLADAQYRSLNPEYYEAKVVTAEDYQLLSDRSLRKVTLSDGSTIEREPSWFEHVLPNYKPARGIDGYVLVTTYGTRHVLSYMEPTLFLIGTLTCFGLGLSFWNLMRLQKETVPIAEETQPQVPPQ
ncbi:MAG: hypothetical protein R3C01_06110 [Planctomycetaceae bacterium]